MDDYLKRSFRWVLDVEGINPAAVSRVRMHKDEDWGQVMEVDIVNAVTRDLSKSDLPSGVSSGVGAIKFLSPEGNEIDRFTIKWSSAAYLPFVELDYASSDAVCSRYYLRGVKIESSAT